MRYQFVIYALALFGPPAAFADCPKEMDTFMSCQISGKPTEVAVCFDLYTVSYAYGPVGGAPDLTLSETVQDALYEPWSGVGRAIWESVTFYNDGYAYEVFGGFDRPFSEEESQQENRHFGGINILKDDQPVANLECKPETVAYVYGNGLYDVRTNAGQSWDRQTGNWE
ncbi:hypothetical protein [Halovulum sp. GXIMD14793]